jgi:ribosomal protein S27E
MRDEEVRCWVCGSELVAKEVVTVNREVKIFITCDSCFNDLIVIDKSS